jgi:hypothetical protein
VGTTDTGTSENPDTAGTASAATESTTAPDVARILAAVAMLGAAIIHFAFAPDHLEEQTSHGVFFLVVGWAQLFGAAALAFSWRPARVWLLGTAALNAGVAALWLLTRTAGLPGDSSEPVGFPDSLATGLEVVAAASALAVAFGWLAGRQLRQSSLALTGLPAVAMVAVVTASVVPSLGGGHAHGEGHGDGDGDDHVGMAAGHHDGAGAAAEPDDWSAQRISALEGYVADTDVEAFRAANIAYLTEQIRNRSRTLGDLPEAEREERIAAFVEWSVDNALSAENGEAAAADGEATMHSHGVTPWQDISDPTEQAELQAQLKTAGTVIAAMPTAADAMAAGYLQVTPYVPGIGAHYLDPGLLTSDGFDPAKPEMLLYNGNAPTSELVGLSYAVLGDEPPEGFVGPNDQWHEHPSLCIVGTLVVGPDSTPDELCDSVGGSKGMPWEKPMWMGHLWQVPGWESPWGLFSGENPVVNMATAEVGA